MILLCACVAFAFTQAQALNYDKAKLYFLSGDYASCITEAEKILANASYTQELDGLYCLLGLSYLKEGNYLRASDIFEIILKEFKDSAYADDARLGLGDSYFLRANYEKAAAIYKKMVTDRPKSKLLPQAYYRLSQCALKMDKPQEAGQYLDKIRSDFPLSPEARFEAGCPLPLAPGQQQASVPSLCYAVQVGCFSNKVNAQNLAAKLTAQGYSAYVEEAASSSKATYRVRVGRLSTRQEAVQLEKKLAVEGYPTRIFP